MLASFPRQGILTFPGYQHTFKFPCSERTARMQGLSAYETRISSSCYWRSFSFRNLSPWRVYTALGTFLWCLGRAYRGCYSLHFLIQSAISLDCARRFLGTNMLSLLLWSVIMASRLPFLSAVYFDKSFFCWVHEPYDPCLFLESTVTMGQKA
jgi:hypothetical protein